MDKPWMNIYDRINDIRYEVGVIEFLDFAYHGRDESLAIPCPCRSCNNFRNKNRETMYNHLMQNGITRGYTTWNYHGEESDNDDDGGGDDVLFDGSEGGGDDMSDDDLDEMLDNIGQSTWGENWQTKSNSSVLVEKNLNTLRKLLDESHEELYAGCQKFSKLQRLFIDKQVASDMRWHKEKRVRDDNIARHPADTEAWKHLDKIDPPFARDPRNIRLGLATDGFNPFGNLSNPYSIWPVFIVPYNLPPWKCMKDPYMFMSMLIPGPKTPVNIDVYLEPLIDELKDLWAGVNAYDALRKEDFTLRAALLWTINDFPAYGMLSGWSVKGYNACPTCMDETSSHYLKWGRKVCYTGHQRFLPLSHKWRKDKMNFDEFVDNRELIAPKSGYEVLHDIECSIGVSHSVVNKKKRKYLEGTKGWNKKSVFFNLPFWAKLKVRHNIDIMHVVKNVTESLTGTLFKIKGKTKDTWKSRQDLMDRGLKKSLHLQ
ncbi:leucine-rich repeat protein [Tanacetum coccineum]